MKNLFQAVILTVLLPICAVANIPFDSLALENDKGKLYVIHKVDKKETLFRLLKRYNCQPAEIMAANPTLDGSSTIFENQVLRIPYKTKAGVKIEIPAGEEVILNKEVKAKLKKAALEPKKLYHVVSIGETLYAISKKYEVTPDQIRNANGLADNNIIIGQKLMISQNYAVSPAADDDESIRMKKTLSNAVDNVPNAPRGVQVREVGIATTIGMQSNLDKNLAMHRTAPIGSYVKVQNEATGDFITAKVIGQLQETGNNQNVLIRLTPNAFKKLNPRDSRIRASVTYEVPRRN